MSRTPAMPSAMACRARERAPRGWGGSGLGTEWRTVTQIASNLDGISFTIRPDVYSTVGSGSCGQDSISRWVAWRPEAHYPCFFPLKLNLTCVICGCSSPEFFGYRFGFRRRSHLPPWACVGSSTIWFFWVVPLLLPRSRLLHFCPRSRGPQTDAIAGIRPLHGPRALLRARPRALQRIHRWGSLAPQLPPPPPRPATQINIPIGRDKKTKK
jgi:hypothetical protein